MEEIKKNLNLIAENLAEITKTDEEIFRKSSYQPRYVEFLVLDSRHLLQKTRACKLYLKALRARLVELGPIIGELTPIGMTVEEASEVLDFDKIEAIAGRHAMNLLMYR